MFVHGCDCVCEISFLMSFYWCLDSLFTDFLVSIINSKFTENVDCFYKLAQVIFDIICVYSIIASANKNILICVLLLLSVVT